MIRHRLHVHLGHDRHGARHVQLRDSAQVRRARERRALEPVVVLVAGGSQPRWRNGLQRRRWLLLTEQIRGDRRCFLMTLRHPPLIPPVLPF